MLNNLAGLMVKFPEKGKVKTRLGQSLGKKTALTIYEALLDNVITKTLPIQKSTFQLGCFVLPSEKVKQFQKKYPNFSFYQPQTGNELGVRMLNSFSCLFNQYNVKKSILIGADIPEIGHQLIETAFKSLENNDLVYGPTEDGGYYLIGMKSVIPVVFRNIDWGTSKVLEQSLKIADKNNLSYTLLKTLSDLDTVDDLDKFSGFFELPTKEISKSKKKDSS